MPFQRTGKLQNEVGNYGWDLDGKTDLPLHKQKCFPLSQWRAHCIINIHHINNKHVDKLCPLGLREHIISVTQKGYICLKGELLRVLPGDPLDLGSSAIQLLPFFAGIPANTLFGKAWAYFINLSSNEQNTKFYQLIPLTTHRELFEPAPIRTDFRAEATSTL